MKAEFFILGALHRADLHPYEIKRRLTNALVECYTDVDVGTLYYAVRQLAKSGDIAPRRSEKVARGGEQGARAECRGGLSAAGAGGGCKAICLNKHQG